MEGKLTIRDLMTREYVGVSESDTVLGAVQLMRDERVGSVVVLRGTEPVGMMTEWDILGLIADGESPEETPVKSVMSSPVLSMETDRLLGDAAEVMSRNNIRRMLVTEADDIAGVLTERDIIAASASLSSAPAPDEDQISDVTDAERSMNAEFTGQSICESCGSLVRNLANVNGQLLCTNCREM